MLICSSFDVKETSFLLPDLQNKRKQECITVKMILLNNFIVLSTNWLTTNRSSWQLVAPGSVNCSHWTLSPGIWPPYYIIQTELREWECLKANSKSVADFGLKRFCWFPWCSPHRIEYEICSKLVPSFCAKVMNSFQNGIFTLKCKLFETTKARTVVWNFKELRLSEHDERHERQATRFAFGFWLKTTSARNHSSFAQVPCFRVARVG